MQYVLIFLLSMTPFVESRTAIPIGVGLGLTPLESFISAYLGSVLLTFLLIRYTKKLIDYLFTKERFKNFARKLKAYLIIRGRKITNNKKERKPLSQPFKALALFAFVAIPLPMTGIWVGSMVSVLMKVDKKLSFLALAVGNFIASGMLYLITTGVINLAIK